MYLLWWDQPITKGQETNKIVTSGENYSAFSKYNGTDIGFENKSMLEYVNNLCHERFDEYGYLMSDVGHFWLEGILLLVVGLFGVAGNIMTIVVLRKMESNTTFNRLLMSLGND